MSAKDDNDNVGYKHPPKSFQFRKGQSGNPKGRPKKANTNQRIARHNAQSAFLMLMDSPIEIMRDGEHVTMPIIEAVQLTMIKKALGGDHRSAKFLMIFWQASWKEEDEGKVKLLEAVMESGETAREKVIADILGIDYDEFDGL